MSRLRPAITVGLLVTLVWSVVVACPPTAAPNERPASSQHGTAIAAYDARVPRAELRALCPCQCSRRPMAAGVATGFGWAMISTMPALDEREAPSFAQGALRFPPDSLPDPIEHVPLAA